MDNYMKKWKALKLMNKDDVWKECIFDFREIPQKCDVCGSEKVRYASNAEIYHGKQFGNGYCYLY